MSGLINEGDIVTLEPFRDIPPTVGDIVLARIQGRRFARLVLHQIVKQEPERYLIGTYHGRVDGWVSFVDIFGRAVYVEPSSNERLVTEQGAISSP